MQDYCQCATQSDEMLSRSKPVINNEITNTVIQQWTQTDEATACTTNPGK